MDKTQDIAMYQVKFVYKDGKDMNINMVPDRLKNFFDALNAKTIFWYGDDNTHLTAGFWTNLEDIRFLQIQAIMGVKHEEKSEPGKGDKTIPIEKGKHPHLKA